MTTCRDIRSVDPTTHQAGVTIEGDVRTLGRGLALFEGQPKKESP
jgi:hypothetical protein